MYRICFLVILLLSIVSGETAFTQCRSPSITAVIDDSAECGQQVFILGNCVIGGNVKIDDGTKLLGNAVISAGAVIGKNVTVGMQAVVGQGSHIGNGCNLGSNTVIGNGARIGSNVITDMNGVLLGTIRNGVKTGLNVVVAEGATIGDYAQLGANVMVDEAAIVASGVNLGTAVCVEQGVTVSQDVGPRQKCTKSGIIAAPPGQGTYSLVGHECICNEVCQSGVTQAGNVILGGSGGTLAGGVPQGLTGIFGRFGGIPTWGGSNGNNNGWANAANPGFFPGGWWGRFVGQ